MAAFSKCVAQKVSPIRCSEKKKYSMMKYFGKSYITLTISQRFTVDITILKTLRSSAVKKPVQPCHLDNKKDDETDTHGGSVTWQNSFSWEMAELVRKLGLSGSKVHDFNDCTIL